MFSQRLGHVRPAATGKDDLHDRHNLPNKCQEHTCAQSGYLHGICGVEDPSGDSELKRICTECPDSNRPLSPFSQVVDKFGDSRHLAMQSSEQNISHNLGKANLARIRANASQNDK